MKSTGREPSKVGGSGRGLSGGGAGRQVEGGERKGVEAERNELKRIGVRNMPRGG